MFPESPNQRGISSISISFLLVLEAQKTPAYEPINVPSILIPSAWPNSPAPRFSPVSNLDVPRFASPVSSPLRTGWNILPDCQCSGAPVASNFLVEDSVQHRTSFFHIILHAPWASRTCSIFALSYRHTFNPNLTVSLPIGNTNLNFYASTAIQAL